MTNTVNSDLLLNPQTNDLDLTGYNLSIATNSQATAQRIQVGLQVFLGEWFLNRLFGMPYFQSILIKNPNLTAISTTIKNYILSVPFVESITAFNLDFNQSKRSLTINFTVTDNDADVISGSVTI